MNKREWAAACRRTEKRLESLKAELSSPAQKSKPGAAVPKTEQRARASSTRVSGEKSR